MAGGLRESARFGVVIIRMGEKVTENHHPQKTQKTVSGTRGPTKTGELNYDNLDSCMVFLLAVSV